MKKKLLAIINILLTLIMLIILLIIPISDYFITLIYLTLFIGWALPYFINILICIALFKNTHHKLSIILSFLNIILTELLIYLVIQLLDKNFIIVLIEYIILELLSIANFIHYIIYFKRNPNPENKEIKEKKKKNNGAIV